MFRQLRRRRAQTSSFIDHVVELVRLGELLPGEADALADLALALGRALAQPALELRDRRGDEDRHRARDVAPCTASAPSVSSSSSGTLPVGRDPVELRAERAGALARRRR